MNQSAVEAIVGDRIDDIVLVQNTQPTEEDNKIWIPNGEIAETQVPTYEDFSQLKNSLDTATDSDIGKALSPKTVTGGHVTEWQFKSIGSGGGGGTSDYSELENKPQINGVTLTGNKSLADLGVASASDVAGKYTKPVSGIPASDLSSAVQASLGKADTALQGQDVTSAVDNYLEANFSNPSNPPLDRTLTSSLSAAPADMVGEIKSAFNDYGVTEHSALSDRFAFGYYNVGTGARADNTENWIRMNIPLDVVSVYSTVNTMKLYLSAFSLSDGAYIGMWNGSTYAKVYDAAAMGFSELNIAEFRRIYPTYDFRLNVNKPSASISYSDRDNIKFVISVNDSIAPIADGMVDEIINSIEFERGSLNSNGSEDNTSSSLSKRIRSAYFFVNGELMVTAKYPANFSIYIFDSDKTLLTKTSAWQEGFYKVTDTKNRLFRLIVKIVGDESSISVNNASDYLSVTDTLRYSILNTVNGLNVRTSALQIPNIKVVNHRGYNVVAPENTLPAFQMSADLGYKYVETDVLFTSDGVPVLMHDASINRTARNPDGSALSSTVNIADITYEQALSYDYGIWKSAKYAGTPIPTFAQFMALCKRTGLHPYVELKNEKTYTQDEVDLILAIVKQYGMKDHVTFISYSYDALALVKTRWDDVELGLNGTVADTLALKTAKNKVFNLCASNTGSSKLENLMENDVPICFWTIDTKTGLTSLNTCYDSILTNSLTNKQIYEALNNIALS